MTRYLRFLMPAALTAVAVFSVTASAATAQRGDDMPGMGSMLPQGAGFDRAFIDNMVPHHRLAVSMARVELARGKRPEVRALARAIISAQKGEITLMQRWRADWFGSSKTPMTMSMDTGGMTVDMLEAARDVDRAFLTGMIPHHRSAIAMGRQAVTHGKHRQLRILAGGITVAQLREIGQMQRWLNRWYG